MECPHCGSDFESTPHTFSLGIDQDGTWQISNIRCPTCDRLVVAVCSEGGQELPRLSGRARPRARLSEDVPGRPGVPSTGPPARYSLTARRRPPPSPAACCSACSRARPAPATAVWPTRYGGRSLPPRCRPISRRPWRPGEGGQTGSRRAQELPLRGARPGERGRSGVAARRAPAALRVLLRAARPPAPQALRHRGEDRSGPAAPRVGRGGERQAEGWSVVAASCGRSAAREAAGQGAGADERRSGQRRDKPPARRGPAPRRGQRDHVDRRAARRTPSSPTPTAGSSSTSPAASA